MPARLAHLCMAHPRRVQALALTLAALAAGSGLGLPGRLGVGSLDAAAAEPAIVVETSSQLQVGSRVNGVALGVIRSQLETDERIATVERLPGKRGASTAAFAIELEDDSPASRLAAIEELPRRIDPGPLRISIGGQEAALQRERRALGGDIWRTSLLALPLLALAVAWLLGARLAARALFAAALAGLLALAGLRFLSGVLDLSLLAVAVAVPVALAGALELSAALAVRSRELPIDAPNVDRVEAALTEGGRDAIWWALGAAVVSAAAAASSFEQAGSLAAGGALGALAGIVAALVLAACTAGQGSTTPREPVLGLQSAGEWLAQRLDRFRGPVARPRWRRLGRRAVVGVIAAILLALPAGGLFLLGNRLSTALGAGEVPGLDDAALACALAASLAIVAGRSLLTVRRVREERSLGLDAPGAVGLALGTLVPGCAAGAVGVGALAAGLAWGDVTAAAEFGLVLAAIVLLDALAGRVVSAVAVNTAS